ncbi:MAG: hypothetical protein QXG38_03240 [Candidatus Hadarchaeales archaeon]
MMFGPEPKEEKDFHNRGLERLRAIASGASTCFDIYERASLKLGPKSNLTYLLDKLVKYGYLERRDDGSFIIPDPVVRYMVTSGG